MTDIKITVIGIEKIQAALTKFPREISNYLGYAGNDAARDVVLGTVGLKNYPPDSPRAPQAQNWTDKQRRYFFWALSEGIIEVPYRRGQSPKSERYGSQWYVEKQGMGTVIGNRTSYGPILGGDNQSAYMKNRGWRKLLDVALEKREKITKIYQSWVDKLIRNLGL